MNDIQRQGYEAYRDDEYAECPYSAETERDFYEAWINGWLVACDEETDYGRK